MSLLRVGKDESCDFLLYPQQCSEELDCGRGQITRLCGATLFAKEGWGRIRDSLLFLVLILVLGVFMLLFRRFYQWCGLTFLPWVGLLFEEARWCDCGSVGHVL